MNRPLTRISATRSHAETDADISKLFQHAVEQHQQGRFLDAIASYERIIAVRPDFAKAYNNRSIALSRLDRYDEALAGCDRVIALKPDYAEAHDSRGNVLHKLGRDSEALASYDRAIALKPDYVAAYNNRGNALHKLGRLDEALASYDRASALKPDYAYAYINSGSMLCLLGNYEEALARCDRAIALKPDSVEAYNTRGMALLALGRYREALTSYERSIALSPQYAEAQLNKSLIQLLFGDFENGFESYQWRWRSTQKPRGFTQPQWRGEDISGKTILLSVEQGLGDTIQMLRYLPRVKAKGARIVLELPKTLQSVLGPLADGVEVIEPGAPLPAFDVYCPLMSLPLPFGTRIDTVPSQVPYLTVPAERMPAWRARLPKSATQRIGFAWSGSATHSNDRNRSIALERLAPLSHVEGLSFVSLQREYRDNDLPALSRLPIERIDDGLADFGDTAAAIKQCDLVISVDTSVAHLAGALGKPVWVLLPFVPDWRWLLDRTDSPWYPTARLFRQSKIGDWDSVVIDIAGKLSTLHPTSR
jgi:tetratricopeptide (TPR) repeat protein